MKNIKIYHADKYATSAYVKVEENIYKGKNPYYHGESWNHEELYCTSLTFEQEPELGEGGDSGGYFAMSIRRYPGYV